MGDRSSIEWTDASWNPVTGCTKVSQGCKNCYAKALWPRVYGADRPFEDVQVHPNRLDQPRRWQRPRRIFVNSMSDLFHVDVPFEFLDRVFDVMASTPRHTYQILTKRPQRALEYIQWAYVTRPEAGVLGNLWMGTSVEDQTTADERIPALLATPAAVRFLSIEPMLGPINLDPRWLRASPSEAFSAGKVTLNMPAWTRFGAYALDWVICGGESGRQARPMSPAWARSLRDQCVAARIPFFFKQWGEWAPAGQVPVDRDIQDVRVPHAYVAGGRVARYGKRVTGRLLDGRSWDELP